MPEDQNAEPKPAKRPGLTRREFLVRAGVGVPAVVIGASCSWPGGGEDNPAHQPTHPRVTTPESGASHGEFPRLFRSDVAQEVADGLGITPGNFWITDEGSLHKIHLSSEQDGYLTQGQMLPIFPAGIYQQSGVIEKVAGELDVPANIVSTIASIESAGLVAADSGVADGLFQVVPGYHMDRIIEVARENGRTVNSELDAISALQDPYIGCRVGMEILKEYYQAVLDSTDLNPNNPVAWARALVAYNGGPSRAGIPYDQMPLETQLYAVHGIRYLITAEIGAQLRNHGMDNAEIAAAISSTELDARAYAYQSNKDGLVGDSIESYERLWRILATPNMVSPEDAELASQLRQSYEEYIRDPSYSLSVAPGLRLWLVNGGLPLFQRTPSNLESGAYTNPDIQ